MVYYFDAWEGIFSTIFLLLAFLGGFHEFKMNSCIDNHFIRYRTFLGGGLSVVELLVTSRNKQDL